jgi:predicted phage baseplate assembly protein
VRRLIACGTEDRCYALDRASGRLAFGDGEHGRVPPLGARVLARRYVSGGGRVGNVAAGTIKQALTGLAGVEKISNPAPAEGGSDAETLAAVARRGPRTLAHRGRGLAAGDLETMAREASPAVAVARTLPVLDAAGRRRPGWVTLVLVPASEAPRPYPSGGLRERVRLYLAERAEAGLVAGGRITVTGPDYFAVEVEAEIIPTDPAAAAEVESAARVALSRFLHPLSGGPGGEGWEPGRSVYLSDVAALLEGVAGVDAVERLALLTEGVPQGEVVTVPSGGTVAAGEIRLSLVAGRRS